MTDFRASYIRLYNEGKLWDRIEKISSLIENCTLCPHNCRINRKNSIDGKCQSGELPIVASYGPHYGEEPPLVGYYGSGTIFLTNCNLKCIFCQNYDISQQHSGTTVSYTDLAEMMIELQLKGCHNINFVTPTHMAHAIVRALPEAIEMGLKLPLVYNSGGFDAFRTIQLLDGIFDIYMPDFKYFRNKTAYRLSGINHYVEEASAAIGEMHRQVGDLKMNSQGIAYRGLIIRHLVLPENQADTFKVMDFVKKLSDNTYLNLMDQYRPEFHACNEPLINRRITTTEFEEAIQYAGKIGLKRLAV